MPSHPGFPPASHVIDYLTAYEQRYRIPVERPVRISKVNRADGIFHLRATEDNRSWTADTVIAATGTWSPPRYATPVTLDV